MPELLLLLAQDGADPAGLGKEPNETFFGPGMVILLLIPIVLTIVLARRRSRARGSELPVWNDETFQNEVLESRMPVLVHFRQDWSVANRATLAQTEVAAYLCRGNVRVGYVEADESPQTMERFPGMECPAYLLFYEGRKLFHRAGIQQAETLQQEIDFALSREGF